MFDRNRRPIVRLAARRWHRQGKIDRATLREILENDDLVDATLAEAEEMQAAEVGANGTLTDFLTWLFEHQEQIIAFITKLISLFTTP